jgi:hypothetical protein
MDAYRISGIRPLVFLILGFWATSGLTAEKATKTYRWVDDKGVVHYGDVVPPEYARQGRSELNRQGVPVREFPRELTAEEATAAAKAKAEADKQQQQDQFLLSTYTRAQDIEKLRDDRALLISDQITLAEDTLKQVDERLKFIEQRMQNFAPYSKLPNARPVPGQLANEAVRALQERRSVQTSIRNKEREREELRAQFDSDLARYRVLTSKRQPR